MAKKEQSQAAQKVAQAEKKQKQKKPKNTNGNPLSRMGKGFKKFIRDFRGEVKKIIWPDGKTVVKSTGVVLAAVAVIGLAIFLVDQGLSFGIQGLRSLAEKLNAGTGSEEEVTAMIQNFGAYFLKLR